MRLRALPLLLALTAADYAIWRWSIVDGHDILSLVSGLTLLPLAATEQATRESRESASRRLAA